MKSGSRELNIFSMSALDLFASAMGAFILIALILIPYFPNTGDSTERVTEVMTQLEQVRQELLAARGELNAVESRHQQVQAALANCEELNRQLERQLAASEEQRLGSVSRNALDACQSRNRVLRSDVNSCEERAKRKFLLIIMSWSTRDDIDLHVIDPTGREFYYHQKSFSGSRGKLEEDNTRGPGNEIWLHPIAGAGTYTVYYKYFDSEAGGSVDVRGSVLTPEGRVALRTTRLKREGDKRRAATIIVDAEGNMRVSQ